MQPPSHSQRRGDVSLQMTPLIDCVFLLLVFFIWTAGFQVAEYVLPSRLSAAPGSGAATTDSPPPPEADFDNIVVRITWSNGQPTWRVNDTPVATLPALRERLSVIAGIKKDAPVILHPDRTVPLGDVIDVYDLSRVVGFEKVQFAAE